MSITKICPVCKTTFQTPANRTKYCCKAHGTQARYPSTEKRFLEKVKENPITGCWEWQGAKNKPENGYGVFCFGGHGQIVYAHRWSFEFYKNAIPDGLVIDHLCRNRICVNPDHLEAVTQKVNNLRGESFAAKKSKQTHCIHGHLFDETNTFYSKRGLRKCRTCDRLRFREKHSKI